MPNISDALGLSMCGTTLEEVSKTFIKKQVFTGLCPDVHKTLIYYAKELHGETIITILALILYLISVDLVEKPSRMDCEKISRTIKDLTEDSPFEWNTLYMNV